METELNQVKGYNTAYNSAVIELKKRDFDEIALNANAVYDRNKNALKVIYLNREYEVDCTAGKVKCSDSDEDVPVTTKVLIMHYLLNANRIPLSGKLVSFNELKQGAAVYYQAFYRRSIVPLVKCFEKNFEGFYRAATVLGGKADKYGRASVTLYIFPLIPITYVIWDGDEELAASGTILFDMSIESLMPGEDIICAASFGTYALIAANH